MNLPNKQAAFPGGSNNAGAARNTVASANPSLVVGEVGFGPTWEDRGLREVYDEAHAQIAVYEIERGILEKELRRLRERIADISNERDFYKAAASKLMQPHNGRRKQ
jgi:hypothetical protein